MLYWKRRYYIHPRKVFVFTVCDSYFKNMDIENTEIIQEFITSNDMEACLYSIGTLYSLHFCQEVKPTEEELELVELLVLGYLKNQDQSRTKLKRRKLARFFPNRQ